MTSNVGFVGLGRMGYPLAGHLSTAGHDVTVFDVVDDAVDRWIKEHNGTNATNAGEVAERSSIVFTSLPADAHLREVAYGQSGLIENLDDGSVWVDHSTASAEVSRELAVRSADEGVGFIDAPVSGGVQGAESGTLAIMIGGDERHVAKALPFMELYAGRLTHMGPAGAGQLTKMANQICVIGLTQALAEGLHFAETAGLDTAKVVSVMVKGSSASWEMENRSDAMLAGEYDFGFSTDLMRKDIGLCLDEARNLSIPLPITAVVDQFLAEVQQMGGSNWDWCSLMERQRAQGDNPTPQ